MPPIPPWLPPLIAGVGFPLLVGLLLRSISRSDKASERRENDANKVLDEIKTELSRLREWLSRHESVDAGAHAEFRAGIKNLENTLNRGHRADGE